MNVETWKPVPGHEHAYEVSDHGRVRSVTRSITQASKWGGEFVRVVTGRLLKPGLASNGYYTVAIGKGNSRTVHSLVAEAFIGPCPEGAEVLHEDGTRTNNCASNLRYGTRRENILDAVSHGTWVSPLRAKHLRKVGFGGNASY